MPAGTPTAVNSAHFDANQHPSMTGVLGTLGTADTQGTALTLPVGVDPSTGAIYTIEIGTSGGGGGSNVNIVTGTQQTLGTVGSVNGVAVVSALTNGSINILTGTIQSSGNGTIVGGTVNNLATGTINALASGTITGGTLQNLVSGTINAGTLVNNGGTLQNLNAGTITALASGTITGGTVQNLVSGTINALASGTITGGTLGNLNAGTITLIQAGTFQLSKVPVQVGTSYGTVGTTGAAVWGTLVASSGNGIKQYVSGVDIVVTSGTVDVAVTNIGIGGSTGAGVLARGQFVPSGGISKNFDPVVPSGTGGTVAFWLGGAGTVAVTVQYFQAA